MRIEVLGPVRVEVAGAEVPLGGPQRRLVLALLVTANGRFLTTEQLIDRIWGDEVPSNARKSVQVHVSKLRSALGDGSPITSEGSGYRLSEHVDVDVDEFERLASEGRELLAARPAEAASTLRRALGLWRGFPYADLRYEESLSAEIHRLEDLHLTVLEDRLEADMAVGQAGSAEAELRALIDEHPYRERMRALHITALYRTGRQQEALAAYRDFETELVDKMGIDPSPELRDLEQRILQQDPLLGPTMPPPTTAITPTALPHRYSSLVGREREERMVADRLESSRLVTLVGPGGIGKTSLAIEVLHRHDAAEPAIWVDVEATPPGELMVAVATAMGLRPKLSIDARELIVGYAGERSYVLMLDGCEGLVHEVAEGTDHLLRACPGIRVVATSREPLGLAGENIVRIGPLDRDSACDLLRERAGLTSERTGAADASVFDSICAALDDIPLAIELAAVHLQVMAPTQLTEMLGRQVELLKRSRTRQARHASLAATLDWSYELLDPEEQRTFTMLSVFGRAFEIGAASVIGDPLEGPSVVRRLVEVSLVQPPDERGRYRMLEPIRQYARFRLKEAGAEDEARDAHARWMVERCREVGIQEWTPSAIEARNWIAANRFELAAALEWAVQTGNSDLGLPILATVGRRLANQGYGSIVLPHALDLVRHPDATPSPELAVAMAHTVHLLHLEGDDVTARRLIDRADGLVADLDDPFASGIVRARRAVFLADHETIPGNLEMMLEAVMLFEEAGRIDPLEYYNTAILALERGDLALAEEYAHRGLDWERAHHGRSLGDQEFALALVALLRGELEDAIQLARRSALGRVEQQVLLQAHTSWATVASLHTYVERYEEAAAALQSARGVAKLVGLGTFDLIGSLMRVSMAAGDASRAIDLAKQWFGHLPEPDAAGEVTGSGTGNVSLQSEVLRGGFLQLPSFLNVLLPLAQALMDTGRIREACRFASASPRLMAEATFEAWDEIGESDRWRRLRQRCSHSSEQESTDMSLEEAFREAARLVRNP